MKPALFLDRDGVINVEKNYVYRVEDFEFVDGIFDLCKTAQDLGYAIVVITNQAGIGRGYYTEVDFNYLTDWMVGEFNRGGVRIDKVYFCPFHPTEGVGRYRRESYDRKPNPGMIIKAKNELDIDLSNSVLVGDKSSDIEAGYNAGIGHLIKFAYDKNHDISEKKNVVLFQRIQEIEDYLVNHFTLAVT